MSIDNNEKLELLWKRSKGVSHTSQAKEPHNEALGTYEPVFQNQIWIRTDLFPVPAPAAQPDTPATWSQYLSLHTLDHALQMTRDPNTPGAAAWLALSDPAGGLDAPNRLTDWVPPRFHLSYRVKVWAGNPNDMSTDPVRLYPSDEGYEWDFDYTSGVLFFYNEVPEVVREKGVWIEGIRYIGPKGGSVEPVDDPVKSTGQSFTYESPVLAKGKYADFELDTGSACVLVSASVTATSTLECHTSPARDDTNPYRFVAVPQHLADDGSYSVAGMRVFTSRFINLQSLYRPQDGKTYWRIQNDTETPISITVYVTTLPR